MRPRLCNSDLGPTGPLEFEKWPKMRRTPTQNPQNTPEHSLLGTLMYRQPHFIDYVKARKCGRMENDSCKEARLHIKKVLWTYYFSFHWKLVWIRASVGAIQSSLASRHTMVFIDTPHQYGLYRGDDIYLRIYLSNYLDAISVRADDFTRTLSTIQCQIVVL